MLMIPSVQRGPSHVFETMKKADKRLVRLVALLSTVFIIFSVAAAFTLPACSSISYTLNKGLDQMSLLMFAMLPVLYYSGSKSSR